MNELIAVSTGLFAGTITGIVPGAGVMVAMIVAAQVVEEMMVALEMV